MSEAPHILVVDDHREIRDAVSRYLQKNGFRATTARDAPEMDRMLKAGRFDLIVLDVMMPGEDGLSVCRRLSAEGGPPILMLTALGEETDRIVGLEIGADDYLPKPFNPRELLARIKAILRRTQKLEPVAGALTGRRLQFAGWELDTDTRRLVPLPESTREGSAEGEGRGEGEGGEAAAGAPRAARSRESCRDTRQAVQLTHAEFRLLVAMLERPRFVLSRDQLLDLTSGRDAAPFDRSIDNLVSRLRRKIERDPSRPEIITTIRGGGYALAADVRTV